MITLEELEMEAHDVVAGCVEHMIKDFPEGFLSMVKTDEGAKRMVMANIGTVFLSHPSIGPLFKLVVREEFVRPEATGIAREVCESQDKCLMDMQKRYMNMRDDDIFTRGLGEDE